MKIIELEIKNVRGVKDIILRPDERNFVVWGTNGSGKSGIVDAIDFLLTGRITRLTGAGTGDMSLKRHGAHIDCDDLSKSYVKATVKIKGVNGPVEIFRCLEKPNEVILLPDVMKFFSPIEDIARRGQHVLTRREILRFITSEGGKRAEDIQSLMDLTEVETIRKSIGRVVGGSEKELAIAQRNLSQAKTSIATRVGQSEFNEGEILRSVNANRSILAGQPISNLIATHLKVDISSPAIMTNKQEVNIAVFEQDTKNIIGATSDRFKAEILDKDTSLRSLVTSIHNDINLLRAYSTQKLVDMGISMLVDAGKCPLCDREWKSGELRTYLEAKSASAKIVQAQIKPIEEASQFLLGKTSFVLTSLERVIRITIALRLEKEVITLKNWQTNLNHLKSLLEDPLYQYHRPKFTSEQVSQLLAPDSIQKTMNKVLDVAKEKFPKSTPEQTAWDTLTELGVELKQLEDRKKELDRTNLSNARAVLLQTEFEKARDDILGKLYDEIKDRFVELYRELHQEDEKNFSAILRPSGAALDFEVDFYGRGTHPPHALHSEGHQDSMGVCLFLALAEKLTSDLIDLIVLDDVVMSVDSDHRRDLCRLLAKNFPGKQFLITTHDRTWAMQLRFNGVVKHDGLYEFFDWRVDTGPHVNDIVDLWARIDQDLKRDDIPSAAAKLRRGSEQFFAEVCHNTVANVPFQIDGRYELGDLLYSAMGQFSDLLKDAKKAMESWGGKAQDELQFLDNERKEVYKRLGGELWAVNVNVHFNDWANFGKNDFEPVVKAYKDLFELFMCNKCQGAIRIVRTGKEFQNVRCNCGHVNWNLVKKKAS
jgi:recombinational DNA repair ATPase RecF